MPHHRLRPLWILLAFVASHALVALVIFITQYEPLRQSGLSGASGATFDDIPSFGGSNMRVFDYQDGAEFEVHFDLFNEGPVPVTITGIDVFPPDEESYVFPFEQIEVRLNAPGRPHEEEGSVPFEPFRLSRGGAPRLIIVRARFDDCEHHRGESGSFSNTDATVRFRVLGIAREQRVPLMTGYGVNMPAKDCPKG